MSLNPVAPAKDGTPPAPYDPEATLVDALAKYRVAVRRFMARGEGSDSVSVGTYFDEAEAKLKVAEAAVKSAAAEASRSMFARRDELLVDGSIARVHGTLVNPRYSERSTNWDVESRLLKAHGIENSELRREARFARGRRHVGKYKAGINPISDDQSVSSILERLTEKIRNASRIQRNSRRIRRIKALDRQLIAVIVFAANSAFGGPSTYLLSYSTSCVRMTLI